MFHRKRTLIEKYKNRRRILIILMMLIISSGFAAFKMNAAQSSNKSSDYPVSALYKACQSDKDCGVVSAACTCCYQEGINHLFFERYQQERDAYCKGYKGAVCECCSPPKKGKCEEGACILVPDQLKPNPCQ